ncbi:MAG: hypothetical protein GXC94_00640 [Comamonadaceae bacterium]|nr:hypothetical protein [Comamonadaceae bacterium]
MNLNSFAVESRLWLERPLCRRYATVVFCRGCIPWNSAAPDSSRSIWWALGTLNDGGSEFLGAWKSVDENAGLPPDVFGQLRERGVLSMRFCIGNIGDTETAFREALRHAAVMPSMQELLASADAMARPRHRVKVAQMLRAVAELEDSQAARAKFGEFQGSELGERYPEIVQQWREALPRFESFYALDAPLRELVRSADRMAADVSECLRRAIKRHGQFTDSTTALGFVVACLDKVERGLDRDRAAALASGRARLAFRRGAVSAPDVAGVLTPA